MTYLSRRARATIEEAKARDQNTEEALAAKAAQEEQRKKESHDMVADSIRRELAESKVSGLFLRAIILISP